MAVQTAFNFARNDRDEATDQASSVGTVAAPSGPSRQALPHGRAPLAQRSEPRATHGPEHASVADQHPGRSASAAKHETATATTDRSAARSPRRLTNADASILAARLELALRTRSRIPLRLSITDNRRTMISQRRRESFVEIRLHHMFLHAEESLWCTLADYLIDADRSAAQQIGSFIDRHRDSIRRSGPERRTAISTAGVHYDLVEIYRSVKQRYFPEVRDAQITWGRDPRTARRSRRSIKLGSYTSRDALIRVHPALDAAFVPRFFVEYIVYHELLHHVLPPTRSRGRRDLHGAAFQAREREFAQYEAALCWERENLTRLLRRSPGKPTRRESTREP